MPGRQSTGPPSTSRPRPKKQKAKRSLNALAIAEAETPRRTKIRQSRLGEVEPQAQPSKRKRDNDAGSPGNDDDNDDDHDGGVLGKRRRGEKDRYGNEIEGGSDSSGNEWVVGEVDKDDDSELDSDEAFGESDEEKFEGFTFGGSAASSRLRKRTRPVAADFMDDGDGNGSGNVDLMEDDDDEDNNLGEGEEDEQAEESDGFAEEAVDLAHMLDDEENEGPTKADRRSRPLSDGDSDNLNERTGSADHESELSISDIDDDAADATKLASLQALVSDMNERKEATSRARTVDTLETTTPSEFGISSKRKLTVADLVPSVTDPSLRRSLKLLAEHDSKSSKRADISRKLEVPLPKRQQDRLDRAAAYEKSKETLDRWIDTVKHNRRAEHLSFPLKDPSAAVPEGTNRLLSSSQSRPVTELETTIESILLESGLGAANKRTSDDDPQAFGDLKTNKVSLKEIQAQRAELRRARELLFREETRAKRLKKIKSKTFRKVHRKERERNAQHERDALAEAGAEESESEKERNDRARAEERMGAKHRESRWAKGVKDSGRAKWDEDARGGVTEMARRGEELRRRMEGRTGQEGDSHSEDSDSMDDDEGDAGLDGDGIKQISRISRQLANLQSEENEGSHSTLANMDFMKRAEAARRSQNEEDAEKLRRTLAGEDTPSEEEEPEGIGRRTYGPLKVTHSTKPANPFSLHKKSEFEERRDSDNEDFKDEPTVEEEATFNQLKPRNSRNADLGKGSSSNVSKEPKSFGKNTFEDDLSSNPWLAPSKKFSDRSGRRIQEQQAAATISNSLVSQPAADEKTGPRSSQKISAKRNDAQKPGQVPSKAANAKAEDEETDSENEGALQPFVLRNADLVRRAFAGDAVVADFAAEKKAAAQAEAPKTVDTTLPGWGSWTGSGLSKKDKKYAQSRRTTAQQPGLDAAKRKDARLHKVIINEKRVKKNGKYLASQLPHPFETTQQYERSLRLPVGPEWTTKETFQNMIKPRILLKQGVIAPMAKPII